MRAGLLRLNDRCWRPVTWLLLALIIWASLWPLPELPLPDFAASDKLHHLLAYAALAVPVSLARPPRWPVWIAGFALLSGTMEIVQPYVNRWGEWADLAANLTGLAIGVGLAALLRRLAEPA